MSAVVDAPVMKIGRYAILDVIGQGAMGTVYKALDPLIERTVAIKTVPIARLKEEGSEFEARFLREAKSAGRLSHPNIVTIYDVGETDEIAYIAMEYLQGTTLRRIMDHGPMPLDLALATALQIAEALAYAHAHGVIHRDIKPTNVVIVSERGQVKLTDFGIAQLANSEKTHVGLMLGSPRYMSPEQAMGREINGSSDVFSLGALIYEMLRGDYAFGGDNLPGILYRVINETPSPLIQSRPEISPALDRLVMRMLNKRAESRPGVDALIDDLQLRVKEFPSQVKFAADNRVPRLLPGIAFATPLAVFLIIGLGIAVIQAIVPSPVTSLPEVPHPSAVVAAAKSPASVPAVEKPLVSTQPQSKRHAAPHANRGRKTHERSQPQPEDDFLKSLKAKEDELQIRKAELLLKYTDAHPDVVLIDNQLKRLEAARRRHLRLQGRG